MSNDHQQPFNSPNTQHYLVLLSMKRERVTTIQEWLVMCIRNAPEEVIHIHWCELLEPIYLGTNYNTSLCTLQSLFCGKVSSWKKFSDYSLRWQEEGAMARAKRAYQFHSLPIDLKETWKKSVCLYLITSLWYGYLIRVDTWISSPCRLIHHHWSSSCSWYLNTAPLDTKIESFEYTFYLSKSQIPEVEICLQMTSLPCLVFYVFAKRVVGVTDWIVIPWARSLRQEFSLRLR